MSGGFLYYIKEVS